ncbi:MAG TPA: hypothetical protein VFT04_11270 [Gemmatimonadales bacterium]|nr:hypothetical protein [Gemmatimonadales bacterium]
MQHLDRDLALVAEVVREVDRGHAAGAELALEAVAAVQRGGEAGGGLRGRDGRVVVGGESNLRPLEAAVIPTSVSSRAQRGI